MPQYLAVVKMHKKSGIPADESVNTFAFARALALDSTGADDIRDLLAAFYMTPGGTAPTAVNHWLADSIDSGTNYDCDLYDITGHLDGSAHGAPVFHREIAVTTATGTSSSPNELAVCMSFRSSYGTDAEFAAGTRPRARDRGRVYLGPLAANVVSPDATTREPYVLNSVMQSVSQAGGDLMGDVTNTWCVWSRTRGVLEPVVEVWCDNAFDVQRRRGNKATTRQTV